MFISSRPARRTLAEDSGSALALTLAYPGLDNFQQNLIQIHALLATVHAATGRLAEARAELQEAERILWQVSVPGASTLISLAAAYAMLSTLFGMDERRMYSDRAMAMLRRAVTKDRHIGGELRTKPGLAPLRSRPDFQLLLMDMDFPDDLFARGDPMTGPASPARSQPAR
jgi:hypothetical protein